MMLHMTPQKQPQTMYTWDQHYINEVRALSSSRGREMPRRIERASMPVRPCPRTELLTLRQEVRRMRREAEQVAKLKVQVETLKANLRHVLDKNRQMSDLIEEQRRNVEAVDHREEAAQARRSQLDCARQLFRAMLDGPGQENAPPNSALCTAG
ncbi:unnamed protein product [Cladocopium goreaui]|uniref:Peptidyl-prolyl cis-trans isomerase D n=1 Tax=Cladocopium goreaui TaxID=2562237 RepID=A0A9P1D0Q0_9DINO|nr:unnamed protein product [Cladocopium goreaui]